jgi:hypothetical protein
VYEQLTELKQTGTVEEYITEFEYLTAQIPKLPDKQFRGYFLHGLKTEIRGKVRSLAALGDLTRTKILQVTRAVEKEVRGSGLGYNRGPKPGNGSFRSGSQGTGKGGSDWIMVKGKEVGQSGGERSIGPKGANQAQNERRGGGMRDRGFTRLSYQELMERKQKGQCFKCKGPFTPTHQCPEKHLRVLIVDDVEGDESEPRIMAVEVEDSDDEEKGEMCMLDLNHMAYENHHTVKFQGEIHGVPVLILVDSGATHNFISQKLVHKMEWPTIDTPQMTIKLGDGSQTFTSGVCRELKMCIGSFELMPQMHLFELGGVDVVLGIEWLQTLGDTIMNWRKQTMSFWSNREWVTLQGIERCKTPMVALQSILSKPKLSNRGILYEMEKSELSAVGQELTEAQKKEMNAMLQQFASVFKEPSGLPPRRNKEHAINLVKDHQAVNVRPYRYPHHHKNEIERQVQEMLEAGIIRPSTSSFSSPVILVKKKDQSWRMCIDYRALNKVTIPDKFPIPVIEELLDELHCKTQDFIV